MADPYTVLGVPKGASEEDIRKAFRQLAKDNHPDLHPGDAQAEKRFKDISAAYDILGDPDKRKRYDAGEIDESGAERPERKFYRQYADAEPNFKYERSAGTGNFEDLGDIFGEMFGRRGSGELRMRGGDVQYRLPVDFLDAVNGARRRIDTPDGKSLEINIPPGLRDGQTLRLRGQGSPGIGGGPPGDALIEVSVRPHPLFSREGNDIRSTVPITLKEALAGGTVRAETISGPVDLKIPRGSNSGRILRLRGKGVPAGGQRGDHLAELRVALPDAPDQELETFVSDWEAKHPYDPRKSGGGYS